MGSVRANSKGLLFFDFYYRKIRCREYTLLKDTVANRRLMEGTLKKIEREIDAGAFSYGHYFPNSSRRPQFESCLISSEISQEELPNLAQQALLAGQPKATSQYTTGQPLTPIFSDFSDQWYAEREIDWKRSNQRKVRDILCNHLSHRFKGRRVGDITKADILSFRAYLAKDFREGQGLSPSRVNQILNILSQVLEEAADRYEFTTPFRGIKPLRVPRTAVDPFSLDEVRLLIDTFAPEYRNYFTTAFFTGLRTSELIGLKWQYVDFERREIHIRETVVYDEEDTPKNNGSERTVSMSIVVENALREQFKLSGKHESFVFCDKNGGHLHYRNISNRVWYPTLRKLNLRPRRPYQTRHTAATLWLAAGESPEWIARQMGHTTTKMLFTVYSRFVPNLTRQDGSAMERLIRANFLDQGGTHV